MTHATATLATQAMSFGAPQWLLALWALPLVVLMVVYGVQRRRSMIRRFVESGLLDVVAPSRSVARQAVRGGLLVAALVLVVVGLARPQWGATPQELRAKGRDVCFVIDVSRSMLAEDLAPNRLERAKLWVQDVLDRAQGDRVAIIAFAGVASVKSPLTHDYGFATMALRDLSPDSVPRGGTLMGDALRLAASEVFDKGSENFRDVILITDGEDHESFPVEAARALGEAGIRLIIVGIGDENVGRPIPVTDPATGQTRLLAYQGQTVLTKLDAPTLAEMARATPGGQYFNVATGTIELDTVYASLVRQAEQRELEARDAVRLQEQFQWFLAAAAALVLLERLISERRS